MVVFLAFRHRKAFAALLRVVIELVGASFEVIRPHFTLEVCQFFVNLHICRVLDSLTEVDDIRD